MKADCHVHFVLDGINWKTAIHRHETTPDLAFCRQALSKYRELGYTYLRDGGDRWGVGAAVKALAPEYGITYCTPLAPLCKKRHYGGFIGQTYESLREYAALVEKNRRSGGDFIKIMISGLMDFHQAGVLTEDGLSAGEIEALVHIAHEEGLSVMAHCNGAATITAAAEAGVDSIEHGAYADDLALQTMAAQKTIWVPTLSTVANLRGTGRFPEEAVSAIYESACRNIQRFAAMGGILAPGSDAGAWAVPHGCDTEHALLENILGETGADILAIGACAVIEKFHPL